MSARRYDWVIIGDGVGAVCAAQAAVGNRQSVALVTSGTGRAATLLEHWAFGHALRQAAKEAYHGSREQPDFRALARRAREHASRFAAARCADRLADLGVHLEAGPGTLTGHATMQAGTQELTFRRAILFVPCRTEPPSVPGAEDAACLTDEDLVRLDALPPRLAVLGEGPWECRWAQTFQRLGSRVLLIGQGPTILPGMPPEVAAVLERQLAEEGVRLLMGCADLRIERTGTQRAVILQRGASKEKHFVDQILLRFPRAPDPVAFRLEAAGVRMADRRPITDAFGRTTNRRIYALPEWDDQEGFGPEAAEALARCCVQEARTWLPFARRRDVVLQCIRTDPEVVSFRVAVEMDRQAIAVDTYRAEVAEGDLFGEGGGAAALVIAYVQRSTGRLLGACLVAEAATELVAPLLVVASEGLSLAALDELPAWAFGRLALLRCLADRFREGFRPSLRLRMVEGWRRWRHHTGRAGN